MTLFNNIEYLEMKLIKILEKTNYFSIKTKLMMSKKTPKNSGKKLIISLEKLTESISHQL